MRLLAILIGILMYIAILDPSYLFIICIKTIVTIAALIYAVSEYKRGEIESLILLCLIVIFFNPIIPFHWSHVESWYVICIMTGVSFFILSYEYEV